VVGSQPSCALNATALLLQLEPTFLPIVTSLNAPAGPAYWYRKAASTCVSRFPYAAMRRRTVEEAQGRATGRAESVVDDSNDAGKRGRRRRRAANKPELATVIVLEVPALRGDLAGGRAQHNGAGRLSAQRRTSG
jgi:hypothetical protein